MATHYVLKADIGGIKGVLAELLRKQPRRIRTFNVKAEEFADFDTKALSGDRRGSALALSGPS
jgi:hypothetical protein